jgi:4a-hydroxytetrahydrobiopterin dehydratase
MSKLSAAEIESGMKAVPGWTRQGSELRRTVELEDFPAAIRLVNAIAAEAEKAQHHPDIDIRWNKVTLALTTHDAGGLTESDFEMAKTINGLAGVNR